MNTAMDEGVVGETAVNSLGQWFQQRNPITSEVCRYTHKSNGMDGCTRNQDRANPPVRIATGVAAKMSQPNSRDNFPDISTKFAALSLEKYGS